MEEIKPYINWIEKRVGFKRPSTSFTITRLASIIRQYEKEKYCDLGDHSDFEKLTTARLEIKHLKFQKGQLESYIDELEYKLKKQSEKNESLDKLDKEEKIQIKKGKYYANLRAQIKTKSKTIKELKKSNNELIYQNIKLKKKNTDE